jgi:DNA polymerase I
VLGWPRILDLFTEFRDRTNGLETPAGAGLIGALTYFGLDTIGVTEKQQMCALILRGGPWSEEERKAILDYCESDVAALARLLPVMLPRLDLPHALVRGRYMAAAAIMEHAGTPIDTSRLARLQEDWTAIQDRLIADVDADYGVYDGRVFKHDRFEKFLLRTGIPWQRTGIGIKR